MSPFFARSDIQGILGWLSLIVAIVLEVCGTLCMKLSHGFARPLPSLLMFVCYGLCLSSLTMAMNSMALGVVYAVWSGIGMVLITAIGVLWFKEPLTAVKLLCFAMILIGVVVLNLSGGKS